MGRIKHLYEVEGDTLIALNQSLERSIQSNNYSPILNRVKSKSVETRKAPHIRFNKRVLSLLCKVHGRNFTIVTCCTYGRCKMLAGVGER